MNHSCPVSTVQAGGGGIMVWEVFSWHALGCLESRAVSSEAHQVHSFLGAVYPMATLRSYPVHMG